MMASDEMEQGEIDALAERAYELRFIDVHAALSLACSTLCRAERACYRRGAARALVAAGAAQARLAELDAAAADLARAFEIFKTQPDRVGRARALSWQGMIARRRAEYPASMRIFAAALALFRAAGDRHGEGDVLLMIGTLHALVGDFVAALETLAQSRQLKEELEDHVGVAHCANDAAITLFELGEVASARRLFEEALALFRRNGARSLEIPTLSNLGVCCSELGEDEVALAQLRECLALSRSAGERLPEARALFNLGRVYCTHGEPQRSLPYFAAAEELSRELGERRTEIDAMIWAGRAMLNLGRIEEALAKLTSALAAAESSGIQRVLAEAHQALAETCEAVGDLASSLAHLKAFQQVRDKVQCAGAELRTQYRQELNELQRTQQETELQVLKAQLQPHFLLNALHSLTTLIERNPADAARMVTHLGDLLRLALVQSSDPCTTLQAEIEFVRAYLKLEQVRIPDTFTYAIHLQPGLEAVHVPHLLLQPLAENAVRHGFAAGGTNRQLEIRAEQVSGDRMLLSVEDNGVGLPEGWSVEASGIGLRNTRLRLQRLYGTAQAFHIGPAPTGGTRVEIRLPISSALSPRGGTQCDPADRAPG